MSQLNSIFTLPNVWFYIFASATIVFALAVALKKDIVHCAMYLAATFIGVAAIYVMLDAHFLAAVQILIYVGAVTVLILFAVLLSQKFIGANIEQHNSQSIPAALLVAAFIALVAWSLEGSLCKIGGAGPDAPVAGAREIGLSLLSWHVLPFEVASVLLLIAMVGSIIIARKDD